MTSPDADLIRACDAARAATRAYLEAVEADAPDGVLAKHGARERAAVAIVTATHAKTTAGLAAKAAALDVLAEANDGSDPPELVALAMALAEDALGVVKTMIGATG